MKKVGFIGWRGMVGSVLMERMQQEQDFINITPTFFTTSQAGQPAPDYAGKAAGVLLDAYDLEALKQQEIIVTCQGGDYTNEVYKKLRATGWDGTGLMPLLHCVWRKRRLLCLTLSINT